MVASARDLRRRRPVKPTSAEAIGQLRELRLKPVLLTGDNERSARAVAAELGISSVIADVLPADKVKVVRELQREGKVVAWWVTTSMTRRRWLNPISASRWERAPTSRSRRAT